MRVIGIDPGKGGAIAAKAEGELRVVPMPLVRSPKGKDEYDVLGLVQLLAGIGALPDRDIHVLVERQQPLPATLGGTLANYGRGYGLGVLEGILATLGMPYMLVTPKRWQATMLADVPGEDTKQRAVLAAQRLFPGTGLLRTEKSRKPDHGFADALLLAEYGWRTLRGAK